MENPIKDIVIETMEKYETFTNDIKGLVQQIDLQVTTFSNMSVADFFKADNLAQEIQALKENKIAFLASANNNRIIEAKTKMIGLQQKLYLNLASIPKRILQSSIDLLSSCYNDDKNTKEVERLRAQLNMTLEMLNIFDHKIQIETNELFDKYQRNVIQNSTMVECCYYSEHVGEKRDLKNSFVPYGLQSAIFNLTQGFTTLNYITILGMAIHQKIYESCFVSPKTNNLSEIVDILNQMSNSLTFIEKNVEQNTANTDEMSKKIDVLADKIDRRNRKEETKAIKLTTCLDWIIDVYNDPKYKYKEQFELHKFAIQKKLSAWNQHLKTDGKKGAFPLPGFDYYRRTDEEMFKKWVINAFFPYYKENSHSDAHNKAFHPKNMDNLNVPSQQDFYADVEEDLENSNDANVKKGGSMSTKKNWTGQEKLVIVLQGLRGNCRISELCNKYGISQEMFSKWRDQLLKDGAKVFALGGVDHEVERLQRENRKLKEMIGELTIELKKKTGTEAETY